METVCELAIWSASVAPVVAANAHNSPTMGAVKLTEITRRNPSFAGRSTQPEINCAAQKFPATTCDIASRVR